MDGVKLLQEAAAAGLKVAAEGELLRIRGPKAAEPVALRLLEHKAVVMAALRPGQPEPTTALPACDAQTGPFRFIDGPMEFGDICFGWTPAAWAHELRRKADRCSAYRPDIADYYRRWAADIERRLRACETEMGESTRAAADSHDREPAGGQDDRGSHHG